MPLIVVGASPVLREVGRIDRRAEEHLADVVHRLRQRVRHAVLAPACAPAAPATRAGRDSSSRRPTSTGCCWRRSGFGRQPLLLPDATQRRDVLVDRHQQLAALQVLIAGADRRALAELLLDLGADLAASTRSAGRDPSSSGSAASPAGSRRGRMFGNTGAPACVGDRLTTYWRSAVTSVVLPADISALASARSGTRS